MDKLQECIRCWFPNIKVDNGEKKCQTLGIVLLHDTLRKMGYALLKLTGAEVLPHECKILVLSRREDNTFASSVYLQKNYSCVCHLVTPSNSKDKLVTTDRYLIVSL